MQFITKFAAFTDSLTSQANPDNALSTALKLTFGIFGGIAVLMVIIGGFQYVLSNGDPQRAAKAKNTIIYSIVGLVVSISAFTIINFVLGTI